LRNKLLLHCFNKNFSSFCSRVSTKRSPSLSGQKSFKASFFHASFQQNVEKANAEEFFEIYKGVVGEYKAMVEEMCNGPSVALEITGKDDEIPVKFRAFCGPSDPVS